MDPLLDRILQLDILTGIAGVIGAIGAIWAVRGKSASTATVDTTPQPSLASQMASAATELLAYARKNDHEMNEVRRRLDGIHDTIIRMSMTDVEIRDQMRSADRARRDRD